MNEILQRDDTPATTNAAAGAAILEMRGIRKTFPGVVALDNVDLTVRAGEIHAIVGENGAGKSTLMKVLSGVYPHGSYDGEIRFEGEVRQFGGIADSEACGLIIIHQELALVPLLSIAENIFLGNERQRFGVIDWAEGTRRTRELLAKVGLKESPATLVTNLGVGKQQLVEIAKALSLNARVLIMDEPTASLTEREIATLFTIMRELKARGVAIVYVSHRMEELFSICDKVSVLRDGHFIGEREVAQTNFNEIVQLMVGRELKERFPKRAAALGAVRLKVEDLADDGHISGINFEVRAGEVLGISGLIGAGRSRILNTLFGVNRQMSGTVSLDGKPLSVRRPIDAIAAGIGYVTEDRKGQGLVADWSVRENTTLVHLDKYSRFGIVNRKAEDAGVKELMEELHVRARDAELEVKSLSGGNEQKVVFAKWLVSPPKVLLLDEPTRGVDVGGKAEIYQIINNLAAAGTAIVMVSSELPEVLAMSDRILVMCEGRQTAIFDAKAATQEALMTAATRGVRAA